MLNLASRQHLWWPSKMQRSMFPIAAQYQVDMDMKELNKEVIGMDIEKNNTVIGMDHEKNTIGMNRMDPDNPHNNTLNTDNGESNEKIINSAKVASNVWFKEVRSHWHAKVVKEMYYTTTTTKITWNVFSS